MPRAMSEVRDAGELQPSTRERVLALVRKILGAPAGSRPLPIDARLSDLGMSSLKMVNLMLCVEAEFDTVIPQSEITPENFESIASVEQMLSRLLRPG